MPEGTNIPEIEFSGKSNKNSHMFLFLFVFMIVVFFLWAGIGKLDVVSQAMGEVGPSGRIKTVQHLEGGIIREILISEGDEVKEDQPLIVLEPTVSSTEVAEHTIQLNSLQAKIIRLNAEINNIDSPISFPDELKNEAPGLVRRETGIFYNRQQRLQQQIAVQKALVRQYQSQIEEISARLAGTSNIRAFIEEQVAISEKLLKQSFSNRMNHIGLLRQAADLQARQKTDTAALQRMKGSIQEAKSRVKLVKITFIEETYNELRDAQRSFDIIQKRILKNQDSLQRTIVRSPVDGIVKTMFIFTVAGILKPGGSVAEIVPAEDHLIIEAHLPVSDVGYVQSRQSVKLRLASPDATKLGAIDGTVTYISPDSFTQKNGPPFFRIKIKANQDHFGTTEHPYRLSPGLIIQCSIITGTRTVLEYLLGPFNQAFDTAMLER
ncbi:MAG: HlyD family type I secretion periplasmic adaptor subunit [Bacteroidetes bacterium]|jgi:membrane fusion protein, adhesin transport system|nr:HlyD family type I secretion periplasmic adaptor subunit [Bacteroidota bacterium]